MNIIKLILSVMAAAVLSSCSNTQPADVPQSNTQLVSAQVSQQKPDAQKKTDEKKTADKTGENTGKAVGKDDEPHSDTLVVYFSRTGNTKVIADYLIELAKADSYEITAAEPYTDADIDYNNSSCRANREQNDKTVRPAIADPITSLDGYDTIFLGYPIWWGQEPRIIDTFLESYDFSDKTVIPFCTSGSSGISVSEKNIAKLVKIGQQPEGRRFAAGTDKKEVKEWYDMLPAAKASDKLTLTVNDTKLTVTLADTNAAKELADKVRKEPVTVKLGEYGGFEKVGKLPWKLSADDESVTAKAGDIMLYQGGQMTIFYGSNTWSYTRLGKVDDVSSDELAELFGKKDITVTLS